MRTVTATELARLKRKPVLVIDETTGEIFGDLATQVRKSGQQHRYRVRDLWLASQAVQHGFRFLTHDRKDFADLPGLQLVVWEEAVRPKKPRR